MDICILSFLFLFLVACVLPDFYPTVMHGWSLWISELITSDCFQIALSSMLEAFVPFVVYFNK